MVAAAGGESATLTAMSGATWLALAAVLLLAVSALADRTSILTRVPLAKPPAVLLDRGEELRRSLGYAEAPVDSASGFTYDQRYLNWNRRNAKGEAPWRALSEGRPAALVFWIRTSPVPMAAWKMLSITDETDPPLDIAGMTRMTLDTKGRLVSFAAVPSQLEVEGACAAAHGLGAALCSGWPGHGGVHNSAARAHAAGICRRSPRLDGNVAGNADAGHDRGRVVSWKAGVIRTGRTMVPGAPRAR